MHIKLQIILSQIFLHGLVLNYLPVCLETLVQLSQRECVSCSLSSALREWCLRPLHLLLHVVDDPLITEILSVPTWSPTHSSSLPPAAMGRI